MKRTMISKTGLRAAAALLVSLALAACSKEPAGESAEPGREGTVLSIAEANYEVSDGGSQAASGDDVPQTRAIVDGGGSTFFTDGDKLGMFLRGDGYPDVDNRIVQLNYPGEGPQKKWNITGPEIALSATEATVTAYYPYADHTSLSAVELLPGPYDVNTRDVVWQRDKVHSTKTQAMFLGMKHAMTRVKIRLYRSKSVQGTPIPSVGQLQGSGVVCWVNPSDATDYRVVAMDQTSSLAWATNGAYILGSGAQNNSARNGSDVWKLAKKYSDSKTDGASGVFAADFPAFAYCYNKTDGGVAKGTWYLPSKQELSDLYAAKGTVEPVITANGGMAFLVHYWSATEDKSKNSYARYVDFTTLFSDLSYKTNRNLVRCIRGPLASDSDSGAYPGAGKVTGVTIADSDDVPKEERVIYTTGQLDLTPAEPLVSGRSLGFVGDGNALSPDYLTEAGLVYDLLLLPVDKIGEGRIVLNLDIDDKLLRTTFPAAPISKWEAGKAYVYDVYVRNGDAQVVFGKATVTPWNDGGSIGGDLDTSKPEYGGGDVQDWGDNEWDAGQ